MLLSVAFALPGISPKNTEPAHVENLTADGTQ